MSAIATEVFFVLVLIIANGIFSGSEIAVVSARKVRLEQMVNRGNSKAQAALKLANSPNDFFSTVQIGITLIGILSGAVGGATLAQRVKPIFDAIPVLKPYSEGISVVIVVTIITYLSLVIGELMPKRVALNNPEKIACAVAKPMRSLSFITAPLVRILTFSTDTLLNFLGIKSVEEQTMTEEEIKVLIEQATQSGTFEESEQKMVERVFRLGDRPIKTLMTPKFDITWLDIDAPLEELEDLVSQSNHSRFPVARESLDNCLGILRGSRFLSARLRGQDINIETIIQPPLHVPENMPALKVLEAFKRTGIHMALINDEYGNIEGLVTLNDLMEAIVGDITAQEDLEQPMIVRREDGSLLVDGLLSTDELKDLLDKDSLAGEETGNYHTLGGFVITFLRYIPKAGEHFEWGGFRFEIMDMDGTRVDKVLISPIGMSDTSANQARNY
ncbi:MAG: hemolysin family protein [Nostocales cyanobacterium 94392]|nr:hemolysin family protein [Nostocales cyanobacterium 94392]